MTRIRPGSLKCVMVASADRVGDARLVLVRRLGVEDVTPFGNCAVLVHTDEEASGLRDRLKDCGDVLVVEFEKWSGSGAGVPREWLLARGH